MVRRRRGGDQLLAVILALCVMGIGYILASGWRAFEAVLDTEPPEIDEEATTHGWLYSRTVTIKLVVHENCELDLARTRVWYSLPYAGPAYQHVDVPMHLEEHSGETWILESDNAVEFQGPATPTIYYEVYDKAGNRDYWETTVYFAEPGERVEARVYFNGKEVNRSSREYISSPDVELAVDVTSGESYVEGAYLTVSYMENGREASKRLTMEESTGGYDYMLGFRLPNPDENKVYTINVYLDVVDADDDMGIASITVSLGGFKANEAMVYAVAALAAASMIGYVYMRTAGRRR